MTDAVLSQSLRRLSLLALLLAAFALAILATIIVPLRVGVCGPADPQLLRYLGTPFFHATGYGFASSLQARIWAGPFLANVALITVLIFGLGALIVRRAPRLPHWGILLTLIVIFAALITWAAWMISEAHTIVWTLASPDVTAASCDIRFNPFTDRGAWVQPG